MATSTERAALHGLRIVTRTIDMGGWTEYEADLLAPKPGVPGNWEQIVCLNSEEPERLRAFANAVLAIADEVEHQYDETDD